MLGALVQLVLLIFIFVLSIFFVQINGARSAVSGDSVISTVTLSIDRTMNHQRLRCEASNAALEEPLTDWKMLTVFCQFYVYLIGFASTLTLNMKIHTMISHYEYLQIHRAE